MPTLVEPDGQRTDDERHVRIVFDGVVGIVEEPDALGDAQGERIETRPSARRQVDRERIAGLVRPTGYRYRSPTRSSE